VGADGRWHATCNNGALASLDVFAAGELCPLISGEIISQLLLSPTVRNDGVLLAMTCKSLSYYHQHSLKECASLVCCHQHQE